MIGESRIRQLFNAFAVISSRKVINEWTVQDFAVDDVQRDAVFDTLVMQMSNSDVERKGKGGLQKSFCAFKNETEK